MASPARDKAEVIIIPMEQMRKLKFRKQSDLPEVPQPEVLRPIATLSRTQALG